MNHELNAARTFIYSVRYLTCILVAVAWVHRGLS